MNVDRRLVPSDQIPEALAGLSDWRVQDGTLTRTFEFKTYHSGVVFATTIGWIADNMDHHPEIVIGYQKVTVATSTHDPAGLTELDFELARRVELQF